jgi:superfamily I DNA/RNA helicase
MPDYKLTDEQIEICDATARGTKSIMVGAYAGTGKTSTIEASAQRVKEPALALAFNRKITDELAGRLPANFAVKSLNGAGHLAWLKTLNGQSVKLDKQKLGKLVTSIAQENRIHLQSWQWDAVREAVTKAMQAGISPGNIGSPLTPDVYENWADLIDVPSADEIPMIYDLARQTLEADIALAKQGHISFDDQIYCPVILGGRWVKYPRVFIDEAQDLNPLNHRELELCSRDDGLINAVGDTKQAIYAFRGADTNSMEKIRRIKDGWEDLKLTMTFRCPKSVVARQQEHAPGYRAHENNHEGLVTGPTRIVENQQVWGWSDLKELLQAIPLDLMPAARSGPSTAILCRNNAPLLTMAFRLIRAGIGCQMQGRDIGRGLVQLTKKLAPSDELEITKFAAILTEWCGRECDLANINQKPERADKVIDQTECLRSTMEGASPRTVGDLRAVLEKLFSREGNPILLSSSHRSKGLEWPLVVHLDPWRIPSKQSMTAMALGDPKPLEQENNLHYVTETRTKHTLVNADLEQFQ